MSSTDWVGKYTAAKAADTQGTIQALGAYGKCYDARSDQLVASLAKSGKGPLMGARGDFRDFEQALKDFTAKALTSSQPPADATKTAYAELYQKQFRYEFYQSYQQKQLPPAPVPTNAAISQKAPPPAAGMAASDADPATQAKNHFGELLGDLPDETMHSLHAAFGEILGPNTAAPETQLLVYRYAIFVLEPPGGQPFSPPPF
jgi:hypothetical protein